MSDDGTATLFSYGVGRWVLIAPGRHMQNGYVDSFYGRMWSKLLNETLCLSMARARVEIATCVEGYNQNRLPLSLGYEIPAAFAAELYKSWSAYATQATASTALMRTTLSDPNSSWGKARVHVNPNPERGLKNLSDDIIKIVLIELQNSLA